MSYVYEIIFLQRVLSIMLLYNIIRAVIFVGPSPKILAGIRLKKQWKCCFLSPDYREYLMALAGDNFFPASFQDRVYRSKATRIEIRGLRILLYANVMNQRVLSVHSTLSNGPSFFLPRKKVFMYISNV